LIAEDFLLKGRSSTRTSQSDLQKLLKSSKQNMKASVPALAGPFVKHFLADTVFMDIVLKDSKQLVPYCFRNIAL